VRPAALEPGVLEVVIDVPAVGLEGELDAVPGQVPVRLGAVRLGDGQGPVGTDHDFSGTWSYSSMSTQLVCSPVSRAAITHNLKSRWHT
jgi:hypothetical protein